MVDESVLRAKHLFSEVIRLVESLSDRTPKQICAELDIDRSTWTKILSGLAHFPPDKLFQFCDYVGSDLPLRWLALRQGFDLVKRESRLERELREREVEIERLRIENEVLRDVTQGKR